jgi:hypothetical protein
MELLLTPPPVPVPQRSTVKAFHKSQLIIVIAYIQMVIYAISFLIPLIFKGGFGGSMSIVFIIPALVVVFTKSESAYRIARIFLIFEYIFIIGVIIIILAFLSRF